MKQKRTGSEPRWILVGMDFSRAARQALVAARGVARERDATLLVVHVIDGQGLEEVARLAEVSERVLRERIGRERRQRLAEALRAMEDDADPVPTESIIAWGRPFEALLKKASEISAFLIVLGTAGHSADLEKALFGSTAEKVLRSASCPVLCVPAE